jgi:chromosome segregation ATPase
MADSIEEFRRQVQQGFAVVQSDMTTLKNSIDDISNRLKDCEKSILTIDNFLKKVTAPRQATRQRREAPREEEFEEEPSEPEPDAEPETEDDSPQVRGRNIDADIDDLEKELKGKHTTKGRVVRQKRHEEGGSEVNEVVSDDLEDMPSGSSSVDDDDDKLKVPKGGLYRSVKRKR